MIVRIEPGKGTAFATMSEVSPHSYSPNHLAVVLSSIFTVVHHPCLGGANAQFVLLEDGAIIIHYASRGTSEKILSDPTCGIKRIE